MQMLEQQSTIIKSKNKFGQYFTPEIVADFMIELADIEQYAKILEPSCGEGIFLKLLYDKGFENVTAYEIDEELANDFDGVRYESFVSASIDEKYDLVIGNPPYIRWANLENELKEELLFNPLWNQYFNSLCDYLYIFILKSIEQLNENGQLIFICPEYWLNTTHSTSLRNYMMSNGCFEEIYHFNETPIFDKVSVSIIIFKYRKTKNKSQRFQLSKFLANQKLTYEILQNLKNRIESSDFEHIEVSQFKVNERWLLANDDLKTELKTFEDHCQKRQYVKAFQLFVDNTKNEFHTIGDICDIGNGLVSGLDKAFQIPVSLPLNEKEKQSILEVVKAKDLKSFYHENITNYVLITDGLSEVEFQTNYPNFYQHFQVYKDDLDKRYQYNREINYWEWVFLRNFNLFSRPESRIFVPCKERISHKSYFRFAFAEAGLFPTQDVTAIFKKPQTKESLEYILALLNNFRVFDWLKYNGIVKGNIVEFSEKPIASIPFRTIDWKNEKEVQLHNQITEKCKMYLQTKNENALNEINQLTDKLFI